MELSTKNRSVPPLRTLFWVSIAMCAVSLSAICIAEVMMPENIHGQKAVVAFYRWFGAGMIFWMVTGLWAYGRCRSHGRHNY
jgi:hypothetical protein